MDLNTLGVVGKSVSQSLEDISILNNHNWKNNVLIVITFRKKYLYKIFRVKIGVFNINLAG